MCAATREVPVHLGMFALSAVADPTAADEADTLIVPNRPDRLASSRAGSAKVRSLSERISEAQAPEIRRMSGWLRSWGKKVPSAGLGHSARSGHSAPGMMTAESMEELKKLSW